MEIIKTFTCRCKVSFVVLLMSIELVTSCPYTVNVNIVCGPTPEGLAATVALCIVAFISIVCSVLFVCGPCKKRSQNVRIFLYEILGWEFDERPDHHSQLDRVECGNQIDISTVQHVNMTFDELLPSYDEVVKNSHLYKHGPLQSQVDIN